MGGAGSARDCWIGVLNLVMVLFMLLVIYRCLVGFDNDLITASRDAFTFMGASWPSNGTEGGEA